MVEKKSKTTKLIITLIIVLVLLIFFTIGGFFAYLKLNGTGTKWGDTYYKYVKDLSESLDEISSKQEENDNTTSFIKGLPYGVDKNIKAEFIDIDNDNTPEMITTYKHNDIPGMTVYYIRDNKVSFYPPTYYGEVVLLYNIELKEYKYYYHDYNETLKIHKYIPVEETKNEVINNTFSFTDEEKESKLDVAEGEIPELSKFDQTFIEIEDERKQFEITENMSEKEIKDDMKASVGEYKDIDKILTDDVKTATENKVIEIEKKKEEIKDAEEEKAKREAEEQEAARKAAEEEAKKGLKVGNFTLKYGTYKCNTDGVAGGTYTLNQDGTFTYKNNWENIRNEKYTDTGSGKFEAYFSEGDDYDSTKAWVIKFTFSNYHSTYEPSNSYKPDFNIFDVTSNNRFQYRQGAGAFIYQGN